MELGADTDPQVRYHLYELTTSVSPSETICVWMHMYCVCIYLCSRTVNSAVGQDAASVGQVCQLSAGAASSPVTAAASQRQHSFICSLRSRQLLEDGALLLLLGDLIQALVGDPGQSLLLLDPTFVEERGKVPLAEGVGLFVKWGSGKLCSQHFTNTSRAIS